MNPFDPEQIDVKAIVDYTDENGIYHSQPVFGFFYRDYQRITAYNNPYGEDMDDPDNWRWDEIPTEFRFRFRWASDVIAHHSVRLTVNVPSMGYWELSPFEFDSYWGDPRNSFISVTQNGHYFKTADNHVFFPIGLNINEGTFGCSCIEAINDSPVDDCEACYELGYDDPCCEINIDKKKRSSMPGTTLLERVVAPAGFVKLDRILHILKDKGGNSFRNIIEPITFDIEFEKMNNYYDRQFLGWEYDRMLDLADELDLRIECTMLMHYALGHHWYGGDNWDWDNAENCTPCPPRENDSGFAYWNGCGGSENPTDFLHNPCMILNYKKKLRYMIARWGFSKNIYLFDLVSEMNNIGDGTITVVDDLNNNGIAETWYHDNNGILGDGPEGNGNESPPEPSTDVDLDSPYDVNQETVRPLVAAWHNEMAEYIKVDLGHRRHLISALYAGKAPMSRYNDSPEVACSSAYFDNSWQTPYIDVIAWNDYNSNADRFLRIAETNYYNQYCWTANFEYTGESYDVAVPGFYHIPKPVIHPESGFIDAYGCDYTGFAKELMAIPFSGNAHSGMSWDEWSSTEHWHWMGKSKSFLENEVLNSIDLGSETWIPSRVLSEDERAEVVYLRKIDDNHKKLVGVIMNRTWNWFTIGTGGFCDQIPYDDDGKVNEAILPTVLHNLIPIGDSNSHIKIPQMEVAKRYHIQYIDVNDLSVLNEETVNTVDSKLRLENYPLLSVFRPFVYFKAWRDPIGDDDDESFMPMTREIPELKDSEYSLGFSSSTQVLSRIELRVYPVPCISEFVIDSSIRDNFVLLDINGNTVLEIFNLSGESIVDVTDISAGAYTLLSLRTGVRKRVIILN